jgi:hypothetical protein
MALGRGHAVRGGASLWRIGLDLDGSWHAREVKLRTPSSKLWRVGATTLYGCSRGRSYGDRADNPDDPARAHNICVTSENKL